jgi:hypothetical protein
MRIASLPCRYVVERTFSWFGRNRRLGKDFGNFPEPLLALATLAPPSGSGCRSPRQDEGDLPLAEPQIPRRNLTALHQYMTAG